MKLLQRLRRRVLLARLPGILLTLLPGLALVAAVAPALWQLVWGPRDLYAMTAGELNGSYAAANMDTIWDWYADTVSTGPTGGETVTAREYLVPLADGKTFIGVVVPARLIPQGDRVLEQTTLWRSDPDNYFWDGSSLTVRGSIRPMDQETQLLYYSYLKEYYGVTEEDLQNFLPLVLVHGQVDGLTGPEIVLLGMAAILLLSLSAVQVSRALRAMLGLQVGRYCAGRPYPEEAAAEVDRLCREQLPASRLRVGRDWLVYEDGAHSWVLQTGDAAWVYIARAARDRAGLRVLVYSRSEPPRMHRHEIRVHSLLEARQVIDRLWPALPEAVFGYSRTRAQAYHDHPARFGRRTDPDSRVWDVPLS